LGDMVGSFGTIFTLDDLYGKPRNNYAISLKIEGELDVSKLKTIISANILGRKLRNGKLQYQELQQDFTMFLGYLFYKNVDNFNLDNHVWEYKSEKKWINEMKLLEITQELVNKNWIKGQSLWEVVLVPNVINEDQQGTDKPQTYSTLILRLHHSLADGISCLGILKSLINQKDMKFIIPFENPPKTNLFMQLKSLILFPFQFANAIAEFQTLNVPKSSFLAPYDPANEFYMFHTRKFPFQNLKAIKDQFNVGLQSVVYSCITKALHNHTRITKQDDKCILCNIPVPVPRTTEKLRNQM